MLGNNAMMVRRSREECPPEDEIWYWAPGKVTLYTSTGVQSHDFEDGKGVLTFSSAVTTIKSWLRDSAVTGVKMPATTTTLDSGALINCPNLALDSLPSRLEVIGRSSLYGNPNLTLKTIPASVSSVGQYAFFRCWRDEPHTITFLGTPSEIYSGAFSGCTMLTDIYVPWGEGEVADAPWGATNATIHYNQ